MAGSPATGGGPESVVEETLAYVARSLVEHPEDVRVASVPDGARTVVRLTVHPDDAGRVIGRGGRVARAIRTVTKAAAAKAGILVWVQIGDPGAREEAPGAEPDTGAEPAGGQGS